MILFEQEQQVFNKQVMSAVDEVGLGLHSHRQAKNIRKHKTGRDIEVLIGRLNGDTWAKLAKEFNISKGRCQQIFAKYTRIMKHPHWNQLFK